MSEELAAPPSAARHGNPSTVDGVAFKVSVVVPVFNSEHRLERLVERLRDEVGSQYTLEIVLVNDGSRDGSASVCRQLAISRPWLRFINLARNFGEHNAVMAGLNYCSGDCAVIIDDDFQNPPGEVVKLIEKLREGFDVVFSRYEKKQHSWLRNLGSRFHNAIATVMLDKPRDLYLSSFKALNRFLIDEITKYSGPYPYIDGLVLRTTNNYGTVLVAHDPRVAGKSNYTIAKLVRLWLIMLTNFSILPLRFASLMGFTVSIAGVVMAIFFSIERIRDPTLPTGWASTAVIFLVVSGIQLFALGTVGEYLGRLFLKDNGSPMYVARETVNCDSRSDQANGD